MTVRNVNLCSYVSNYYLYAYLILLIKWYGNSLFDIAEKYIVIAKYLIKYMIYVWRLHKEYTGCSLPCSHQGKC